MRKSVFALVLVLLLSLSLLAVPAAAQESGTAYPSTQVVLLRTAPAAEGQTAPTEEVVLYAYALKDPVSGYLTNYVKLRDAAMILRDTPAAFNVSWDRESNSISLTSGAYEPNGMELIQNFAGEQPYQDSPSAVLMNGESVTLNGILFTDNHDGGYTYVKLRDIGLVAGFDVIWQDGAIILDPFNPYSPNA